jgi:hypothetical protein
MRAGVATCLAAAGTAARSRGATSPSPYRRRLNGLRFSLARRAVSLPPYLTALPAVIARSAGVPYGLPGSP